MTVFSVDPDSNSMAITTVIVTLSDAGQLTLSLQRRMSLFGPSTLAAEATLSLDQAHALYRKMNRLFSAPHIRDKFPPAPVTADPSPVTRDSISEKGVHYLNPMTTVRRAADTNATCILSATRAPFWLSAREAGYLRDWLNREYPVATPPVRVLDDNDADDTTPDQDEKFFNDATVRRILPKHPVRIREKLASGATSEVTVTPAYIWYGTTGKHQTPQWFMRAKRGLTSTLRDYPLAAVTFDAPKPVPKPVPKPEPRYKVVEWNRGFRIVHTPNQTFVPGEFDNKTAAENIARILERETK